MKIFALGPPGSYGHEAAVALEKIYLTPVHIEFCSTNTDLLRTAERNKETAIVPIENSTEGDVTAVLKYFATTASNLQIAYELVIQVRHILLAKPGRRTSDITTVYSHPQALGQCRKTLEAWGLRSWQETTSTSRAAEIVAKLPGKETAAAIASPFAGKIYNLSVLATDINDHPGNRTRFFVFTPPFPPKKGAQNKTVIMFQVQNKKGMLLNALSCLASFNLTAIHSISLGDWQYAFYVEFEGHISDPKTEKAISRLKKVTTRSKVLGSFPILTAS